MVICLDNSLIGNVLELVWSIDKFLPNLVGKLDDSDEVADAESKAHLVFCFAILVMISVRRLDDRRRARH